jgi:hypothetical protein
MDGYFTARRRNRRREEVRAFAATVAYGRSRPEEQLAVHITITLVHEARVRHPLGHSRREALRREPLPLVHGS